MMEYADYTEIAVHEASTSVASLMYYDGIYIESILDVIGGWEPQHHKIYHFN